LSGFADAKTSFREIRRYCDVTGYVAPQNKFELKLPLPADWNHKLFFEACGGFCGALEGLLCNLGLARGYAAVTGNGGHESASGFDGAWAANAPELQNDFGWRSTHVVTLAAKQLTTRYYGLPIAHAYLAGNSKGGQAVLIEAQRFPNDFDGLMPSAPVYDYTGRNMIAAAWFAQAIDDGHGGSVLDDDAAQVIHESVLLHCGSQAGVDEGLVTDPPRCTWQPEMVVCPPGASTGGCLTPRQVSAVHRLMLPAQNSAGQVIWRYPYLPGTETQWAGWNYFGAPSRGIVPRLANVLLPEQFGTFLVDATVRPRVSALTFDFDRDPPTLSRARGIYDATSADIRVFKQRGGKIVMWHGWADGAVSAASSIGYYEAVRAVMGGRADTENFFRLFLVPGVHHGGGGPGFAEFDTLTALERWVENGEPPMEVIASRSLNGVRERSRPVYPYPVLARYTGHGDPKQAASFERFDPDISRTR
jgi:feruloyl esterase